MIEPGQVLDGKYRIVRLIGEGGMGAVFEGENVRISRRVAIKVLHGAALTNPETVQRFEREAQAAGRIGSEHILEILDLGVLPDGERYMVMEYLAGETLSARIRRLGRVTPNDIVPLIRQALVGLDAAHRAGIVHRDLKPDNLFILQSRSGIADYVKIIDFGISKFNALGGDMGMTRTGAVMGTPYYMSPEQAKGAGQIDQRSDLYTIGVILYEAATGEVPFTGNTFNELMFKIVLSDPAPLEQVVPGIDPQFAALVAKSMAREPAQRFANAKEMIDALDTLPFAVPLPAGHVARTQQSAIAPVVAVPNFGVTPQPAQGTQGTFASSQALPSRSGGAKVGLVAAAAVLLLGGGAFAAFRVLKGKGEATAGASAAVTAEAPVPAKPAAEPTPPAPTAATPTPAPEPAAPTPAASTASEPAPAPATSAAPGPGPGRLAASPHRPSPAPVKPKPGPAAKPGAAATATATKSSRDFGY